MPASEAIASDIGHGALGVRYGLRPFRDLLSETAGQRHLWVELRPKKVVSGWTGGGSPYTKAVAESFDGVTLDVVGVQTLTETLTRVEGTPSSAGKFSYDGATLTIYLTGGANPSGTTVVAQFGVHVSTHGVYQPLFASDRLTNGSLEAWTGANPDGWTVGTSVSAGAITLDKTTSDPLQGAYAARLTFAAATGYKGLYEDFTTLAAGTIYRLSGAYRNTCAGDGLVVALNVVDGSGTNCVLPDGRTIGGAAAVFGDSRGDGEWRRFAFDFVCPPWQSLRAFLYGQTVSGTQSGTVDFDDLKLQPVSRYAYHEPLLSADGLPTIEAARADSFWGAQSSAIGSLSLLNGAGRLEPLLASYDWLGADAIVRVGGRFQIGGNETLIEDCRVIATAKLGAPRVTDSAVAFDLEDDRRILQRTLPSRTYNDNGGTDAYAQPDRGRSRPLLFGAKTGIRPVQYDIWYPGGGPVPFGKYELVDCTDWAPGIKAITPVYWYLDESAATARSSAFRIAVPDTEVPVVNYLSTGRIGTYGYDMLPIVIDQENNKLYFDTGGAILTAVLATGVYAMAGMTGTLISQITAAMVAVDGADVYCVWNSATQKASIGKSAGTLNLRCATGSDVQNGLWAVLGFDATADRTGNTIYTAPDVTVRQAGDQVIRCDAVGFIDDAGGTYTGSAAGTIEKAPDIAHFILRVLLGQPASAIDVASFVTARTGAKPCSLYIQAPRTVADIFEELETSGNFDLVLSGGIWSCVLRDTSVPAGTPSLQDADFLSFESSYSPDDLYGTVTLTYNESPDGGDPVPGGNYPWSPHARTEMGELTDATMALRFGRPDQRTFATCLRDAADATTNPARLQAIAAQCSTPRRRFSFSMKGRALMVPVSGKIQLTRAKGLDPTGALSSVLVRVISKRDDWARWRSDVEAIEVV